LALILSLLVVSVLYVASVFVAAGVLGGALAGSTTPISSAARVVMGKPGYMILAIGAVLAFVTTANAGIMAAARYLFALSRDGMLPDGLAAVHPRFKTPHRAVLLTGALVLAVQFLKLKLLVEAASSVLIVSFVFSCLSVIVLRESRLQNYLPRFKAPLYPWLQIVGLVGFTALLVLMGLEALIVSGVFIAIASLIYWLYGRIRATREYALLYLVERIAARELTSHHLETELKDIIHERDDVVKDRFDYIVENTDVLDLEGPLEPAALFDQVAATLAPSLEVSTARIMQSLTDREEQSTTALTPFVAIPHIILEGTHHFRLLIVRCRDGVRFSEASPAVRAVFVLAGTLDERLFHLQALAALASIVQNPQFETRWLAARGEPGLRDVLLLGQRRRFAH
jgi:APA family basic amino acid/polyamine antiporter